MADRSPASASSPTSANRTKKTRDERIAEYVNAARESVQAARERAEANSDAQGNTSPTSPAPLPAPLPAHDQPMPRPSPVTRSASQWPFPKELNEPSMPTGRTQGELAPYRERAPQFHQGLQQPLYKGPMQQKQPQRQPQRSQGQYRGQYRGPYQGPYRGTNPGSNISGIPTGPADHRNGPRDPPPPRGPPTQQQHFRVQNSTPLISKYSRRSDSEASREYFPSSNVHVQSMSDRSLPAPLVAPLRVMTRSERPQMLSVSHSPNIPAIAEENENRTSLVPSISSGGGASDVLSDYYRPESSQGSVETYAEASPPEGTPPEPTALGRQINVSHLQKPTLTIIRTPSTSRAEDKDSSQILTAPFEEPLEDDSLDAEMSQPKTPKTPKTPEMSFHTPLTSPAQERFLAPSSPGLTALRSSPSDDSLTKLNTKHSRDSLTTTKVTASPRAGSKSPLRLIESKFRRSTAEPDSTSPGLQPARSYFTTAPSSSTVDLIEKQKAQPSWIEDAAAPDNRNSRTSMTSLPGLITRALRLATNIERGKTSSKFGLDWMISGENGTNELTEKDKHQSTASLKTILRSFPVTPGGVSPRADRGQLPLSQWPKDSSGLRHSQLMSATPSESGNSNRRPRQFCFMPLWLFVALVIAIVLVVAAAIIIPVVLIVPNQDRSDSSHMLAACTGNNACAHGATMTLNQNKSCSCLCVNGWAGPMCNNQDMTRCVTTDLSGSSATVGSAIPRLITLSQNSTNPLDATTLFESFKTGNLSCASQNALVTFDRVASRRLLVVRQAAATSNGIIFAQSGASAPTSIAASSSLPTELSASSTATAPSSPTTTSTATSQHDMDFARTAVLYIFEKTSDLNNAISAQNALQLYLSQPSASDPDLNLGNGWIADVVTGTVTKS